MRYVDMGVSKPGRLRVPRLDGGLNLRDGAAHIADNQLADGVNLWWRNGTLRTRPGWRSSGVCHAVPDACARTFSREDAQETVDGTKMTIRRFVERQPAGAALWSYRVGTLYADGRLQYSAPLTFSGGTGSVYAAGWGTAVDYPLDAQTQAIVFFSWGELYALRGTALVNVTAQAYVPRRLFGGIGAPLPSSPRPSEGIELESANVLTPLFKALYTTDGTASAFFLPVTDLDNGPIEARHRMAGGGTAVHTIPAGQSAETAAGIDGCLMRCNRTTGCVYFTTASGTPAAPPFSTVNNLEITASKTETGRDQVYGMTFHTWFGGDPTNMGGGNRLFMSGHGQHIHLLRWSHFDNPLYFPAYNLYHLGAADEAITGFGRQGDMLVVFKERSLYGIRYIEHTAAQDEGVEDITMLGSSFLAAQLHPAIGCSSPLTVRLCGNRLLWADKGRVYMLTDLEEYSRCNVRRVSALVEEGLAAHTAEEWAAACGGEINGCYILSIGRSMYLMTIEEALLLRFTQVISDDKAQKLLTWYRWETDASVRCALLLPAGDGAAMLARVDTRTGGLIAGFTLEGEADTAPISVTEQEERPVAWRLTTRTYDMDAPERSKTILSVQVGVAVDERRAISFGMATEAGERYETLPVEPGGGWTRRMPAGLQARRFGVTLAGSGPVGIDGLTVAYRLLR